MSTKVRVSERSVYSCCDDPSSTEPRLVARPSGSGGGDNLPHYICCYGAWLPGQTGAVPMTQNAFDAPLPEADAGKERRARTAMSQQPNVLDATPPGTGAEELAGGLFMPRVDLACRSRSDQSCAPCGNSRLQTRACAECLESLQQPRLEPFSPGWPNRRRWARHGSTRYLWTSTAASAAIHYVVREQGDAMAVFEMPAAR